MKISLKNSIFLILSVLTTVAVFAYLFKTISISDVKQVLKEVELSFLLAFIILSLTGTGFRTWRYRLTLRSSGYSPPILPLYLITLVRNFFSDIVPARIGSAIYIYLANTRLGIPVAVATNSWALSLLFDLVALGPLVILALLFAGPEFPFDKPALYIGSAVIFLFTFLIVWFLPSIAHLGAIIIERMPLIPKNIKINLAAFSKRVATECTATKQQGTYFNIFLVSIFVRLCKYGSLYVFLVGMLLPLGFGIEEVSPVICTVGILAAELAASLPISGIAGFGAYEGAWAFTFSLMGFPSDIAKLTAFAHHLFTQVWGYGIGLAALGLLMLPVFLISSQPSNIKPLRRWSDMSAQVALFAIGLLLTFSAFKLADNKEKPEFKIVESTVPDSDATKLKQLAKALPGKLFFDSNRSGTFGIYSVNTDGTGLTAVVDDPKWHEVYPDVSPDGKLLVYARTRSLTRQAPSEVWLADIDGSNARKLADSASFPTFDLDGETVYLEIDRSSVHSYNLKTGKNHEIFPKNRRAFRGRQVIKPRIAPDRSAIAITLDNPGRWHAWFSPLEEKGPAQMIAKGCEPTWFPDSNKLAWMQKTGARGGSGINYYYRDTKQKGVLKDDPGPMGHEYFPTVTSDGRFLLYSACPENQHDHLTANYNLYVFDIKEDKTWRVTFDSTTNRWPKYAPAAR